MSIQNLSRGERFDLVMVGLSTLHKYKFSDADFTLWEMALEDYEIADIECAFKAHLQSGDSVYGKSDLTPSHLIKHIKESASDRVEAAFQLLIAGTRQAEAGQNVVFPDPLIHLAVMRLGGWPEAYFSVCPSDLRDHESFAEYQKKFIRTYEQLLSTRTQHPAYLPGRHDMTSPKREYAWVADEAACDKVVRTGYDPQKPPVAAYLANQSFTQLTNP